MLATLTFALQSIFYLFGACSFGLFVFCLSYEINNASLFLMIGLLNIFIIFIFNKFSPKLKLNLYSLLIYFFLIWVLIIIISSLPFLVINQEYSINEILFLGTSLATTTGFSLNNISIEYNTSLQLWRSIVQFIGATFTMLTYLMLFILFLNRNKRTIFFNKKTIILFISFTVAYLFFYFVILCFINNNYLENFMISSAIFSTGGLVNKGTHILDYELSNNLFLSIYIFLMFLSILFLPLFIIFINKKALQLNFKNFLKRNSLLLIFISSVILFLINYGKLSIVENLFIAFSFLTTTGFLPNAADNYLIVDQYRVLLFFLFILTIFGTFSGFAGGGLKIDKISIIGIEIKEELNKFIFQHNIKGLYIKKRGSNQNELNTIYALITSGILLIVLSILLHSIYGFALKNSFIYSLAALTNIGEGLLIMSNINRYCDENLYFILNILMLCGRFENIGYLLVVKKVLFKN